MPRPTLTAIATALLGTLVACTSSPEGAGTGEDRSLVRTISASEYYDKLRGAWLGASVAGALGMSVEGMHKRELKPYLESLGQWPLTSYIRTLPPQRDPDRKQWYTAEDWGPAGFGPDDDTLYQVANLLLLEEQGPTITSQDIADQWLASFSVFEAQNCERAVRVAERLLREGVRPPESGQHEMGEFMGGQMKGEFWGYVLPGNPAAAAEYGRMDAEVAFHTDGVHGEMFMAALTAEAFFESNPRKLLRAGLEVIPDDCDYARCIRDVMQWHERWPDDWEKAHEQIDAKWAPEGDKNRRVFPNNAVNALALLYGGGDFDATIGIAVMAGWDTDTNAGDMGPVMGIILGPGAIAEKWTEPIANSFRCDVRGAETWSIDELARRTAAVGQRMTVENSAGAVRILEPQLTPASRDIPNPDPAPGGGIGSGRGTRVGGGIGERVFRVGGGVSSPRLLHKVEPEYSQEARKAKYQGTVMLGVEVWEDGMAHNIRILRSLGLGLDEKAVEAVKQWRFSPAKKEGKPVKAAAQIQVSFRLL